MTEKPINELLDILKGRIVNLEANIESWRKSPSLGDEQYGNYIEGVIEQARDEQKFLNKVIMQVEFYD